MAVMHSNALHLYQLTYTFVQTKILSSLQWPELETHFRFWVEAHQKSNNYIEVLPILTCEAAGGSIQTAVPVAAFWMLSMLAARILDDIQDGEGDSNPWNNKGYADALPVSTALLSAANVCLAQLKDVDEKVLPELLDCLGRVAALAAKAQKRSGLYSLSEEQYFQRIIASSGAVFAAVSWAGARVGTNDPTRLQNLYQFGYNIGMREAIRGDCRDLRGRKNKSSDLLAGIYTLPVIYAASLTSHPCHPALFSKLENRPSSDEEVEGIISLLSEMGALDWSMGMAHKYHEQAVAVLESLPMDCAEGLRIYVS
jgi:hypothetical protein